MNRASDALTRAVLVAGGVLYSLTGLALLVAPRWFYETIGQFPPYNRHYMGDAGAFILPIGIGLLVASRNPSRFLGLIGVVAAANMIHAVNHVYDAVAAGESFSYWISDTIPLILFAVVFLLAARKEPAQVVPAR